MLNRSQQPPLHTVGKVDIPLPEKHVMPNGITMNVLNTSDEEMIRLDLLINGGGLWYQSQPLQATFANSMLRQGTRQFSSEKVAERLDYYGGWLESSTIIKHSYVTLYSLSRYFPQLVELLRSVVMEPLYPEKELSVALERGRQQFKVGNQRVDVKCRKAFRQALFGTDFPSARYAVLEDYGRLKSEALAEFHRQFYHSGNCTVYLSGKVTAEAVRLVKEAFGTAPWGDTSFARPSYTHKPVSSQEKRVAVTCDQAVQSAVNMGFITIDALHSDFHKLRVLVTLFGGYFGSRLMKNIREEKGYTYGIGAGIQGFPGCSLLSVNTQAANEYVEPLIREVYAEMDRLRREPVPEGELMMVKNYMMGMLNRAFEGPLSLADAYLFLDTSELPYGFMADSARAISEVTAPELRELACRYLLDERVVEAVAGAAIGKNT